MDCCSPYPEFPSRHPGLSGTNQEVDSPPYFNYINPMNSVMRYPMQNTVPSMYRGGGTLQPLPSPVLPHQSPSNGIDSPVYNNEYPNNDRYTYQNQPYGYGTNNLLNGGYFNGYNRDHNSNYFYHPYDGYNRYSYHHKDTYSSNYNTYSSPYYQRDHNHHHHHHNQPHHHYHNPYMYNQNGPHTPQPSYPTDESNQTSSGGSNSNTPGSLYSEYPQSPATPYPNGTNTSNGNVTPNATGFPYTNKDGKIRKSTSRGDKEKSKLGNRKSNNTNIDSSVMDPINRCGTPFHGQPLTPGYTNDPYTNFPFGMMNRMNYPTQNSHMSTQPLPSNFLGNQSPWNASSGNGNRNKKGTISDEQMPPPVGSVSSRALTPKNDGKNSTTPPSDKCDNLKSQTTIQPAPTIKATRPVKRTKKKPKPNVNSNVSHNGNKTSSNIKIEQTQKEQKLADINKNVTPLPGFQQAFGSTEIGKFSEVFFNLSESPIVDQIFVESEADTLSPQPWETGDSLEGPHFNLQIGAYYSDNYYNSCNNSNGSNNNYASNNNNNGHNSNNGSSNNTNSSDLYPNNSNCINLHNSNNNNNNYYQYDSGGSSCSTNSNNYSLYNSNISNNNFIGNTNNINNCYFREIRCSDY